MKDWHVPLPGCGGVRCEFPSSRAPEHPSVADLVRVVLEWMTHVAPNRPRLPFQRHPAKDGAFPRARMFGAVPRS